MEPSRHPPRRSIFAAQPLPVDPSTGRHVVGNPLPTSGSTFARLTQHQRQQRPPSTFPAVPTAGPSSRARSASISITHAVPPASTMTLTSPPHAALGSQPSLPQPNDGAIPIPSDSSLAARPAARGRTKAILSETRKKPETFIQKLFTALQDPLLQKLMTWENSGRYILIFRTSELMAHFEKYKIFKQTKWASFTRQLNIYGFKKTTSWGKDLQSNQLSSGQQVSIWQHDTLTADSSPQEIASIKRRTSEVEVVVPSVVESGSSSNGGDSPPCNPSQRLPSPPPKKSGFPSRVVDRPLKLLTAANLPSAWPLAHPAPRGRRPAAPSSSPSRLIQLSPPQTSTWTLPPLRESASAPQSSDRFHPYPAPDRAEAPKRQWSASQPSRQDPYPAARLEQSAASPPLLDAGTSPSLDLPMLNPPPLSRPVPSAACTFPINSTGGSGIATQGWYSPLRPVTPIMSPPMAFGGSPSADDDFDYPTPMRSPLNSSFPLDDPSGWSTITDDDFHSSLFHAIDCNGGSSTSASSQAGGSHVQLPPPAGHAHPRYYTSSSHSGVAQPQPPAFSRSQTEDFLSSFPSSYALHHYGSPQDR